MGTSAADRSQDIHALQFYVHSHRRAHCALSAWHRARRPSRPLRWPSVSMHCAGLYDRTRATMPGFSAKYVKSSESHLVTDFLQRLRLQQLRLKVDLRADPIMKAYADEHSLQANLQRLEALDRLSLYFCLAPLDGSTIDAVPVNGNGREAD